MESASNVFAGGLVTDMHPLSTSNDKLTDALNATFVTYNGNEMLLLNDMGNTLILDSKTGGVMGLSEGFIPVGMKEYGGVLYIASYNPETKEGELGTIPSPKLDYIERASDHKEFSDKKIADDTIPDVDEQKDPKTNLPSLYDAVNEGLIQISDATLNVGDLFMIVLDIPELDGDNTFKLGFSEHFLNNLKIPYYRSLEFPLVTGWFDNGEFESDVDNKSETFKYGLYNIELYSIIPGKQPVRLTDLENIRQEYYIKGNPEIQKSPYWFVRQSQLENKELDMDRCMSTSNSDLENVFKKYPNILKGKLAIKVSVNYPENINMIENLSTGLHTPFAYVTKNND